MNENLVLFLSLFASSGLFYWVIEILKKQGLSGGNALIFLAGFIGVVAFSFDTFVPIDIKQNITTFAMGSVGIATTVYELLKKTNSNLDS